MFALAGANINANGDPPERPPSAPAKGAAIMLAKDPAAMAEKATNLDPPY